MLCGKVTLCACLERAHVKSACATLAWLQLHKATHEIASNKNYFVEQDAAVLLAPDAELFTVKLCTSPNW